LPHRIQIVSEQFVGSTDRQQHGMYHLHQRAQCGVWSSAGQIGDDVLCDDLAPFGGETLPFIGRLALSKQVPDMSEHFDNLSPLHVFIHREVVLL
jgi:hypothetical protein